MDSFGKSTNDINVICANGCAIVFGLIEIIVYLHFKKKYGYNDNSTKTIGIESSQVEEQKKKKLLRLIMMKKNKIILKKNQ